MDRNLASLTENTVFDQIEGFAFLVLIYGKRDLGVRVPPRLLTDPRDFQDETRHDPEGLGHELTPEPRALDISGRHATHGSPGWRW